MKAGSGHRLTAREKKSVVLGALAGGTFFGVVNTLVAQFLAEPLPLHVRLIQAIATGVFFGVFMGLFGACNLKRSGGRAGWGAVMRALKTRTLTDELDPQIWDVLLARQEKSTRTASLYAAFFFVFGGGAVLAALTGGGESPVPDLLVWAAAVILFGFAVLTLVEARIRRRKVRALRAQLARSDSGDVASPTRG